MERLRGGGDMCAAQTAISVGDDGVLNTQASAELSEIWIDRDLGWLDFNERVLAEALDERTPCSNVQSFWQSSVRTSMSSS
jgi:hypothetical protein